MEFQPVLQIAGECVFPFRDAHDSFFFFFFFCDLFFKKIPWGKGTKFLSSDARSLTLLLPFDRHPEN